MGIVISADEMKKAIPGYVPSRSEKFHIASAKLADRAYIRAVKSEKCQKVILMSGGSASGKTEYVSEYLHSEDAIIFDGTLPTYKGAKIKIARAAKAEKKVEVHAVIPKDFKIAFLVFLNRERKFGQEHFFRTHSHSRATLLNIAREIKTVKIRIITSEYTELKEKGMMKFTETLFRNRGQLIEYLEEVQYTENEIRNGIAHDL